MKKLLSLFVAIVTLLSCVNVFAEDDVDDYSEKYSKEIEILERLSIYSPGDSTHIVTQKEFLEIVAKISNVEFDKFYYEEIGILPFSTGRYDEEENITYADAVKTMVVITGFKYFAEREGGFPNGYMNVANQYGITENISMADGELVTSAVLAKLIYNTINTDILKLVSITGKSYEYEVVTGETLLKNTFNIYKARGIVQGSNQYAITDKIHAGVNEIIIDNELYEVSSSQLDQIMKMLGMYIEVYYKEDSGIKTAISVEQLDRNKVIELYNNNIINYADRKYTYYDDNDREKTVKLSIDAEIVYNETRVTFKEIQSIQMCPDNGVVKLIDNNKDGLFDVIIISAYEIYVVDDRSVAENLVYPKYGKDILVIDPDNTDLTIMDSNGGIVDIDYFKQWDVLNVMKCNDRMKITVTRENVTGNIGYFDRTELKIKVDDNVYDVLPDIAEVLAEEYPISGKIILYFDTFGRVAAYKKLPKDDIRLGYLVDVRLQDDEEENLVMLYDFETSQKEIYNTAEKVKLEEEKIDSKILRNILMDGSEEFNSRLIRFQLDNENKIKYIDTFADNNNSLDKNEEDGLIRLFYSPVKDRNNGSLQGYYFKPSGGTYVFHKPVMGKMDETTGIATIVNWVEGFYVDSSIDILYVPADRSDFDSYERKKITDYNEGERIVEAYRVGNDDYAPSLLLVYAGTGAPEDSSGVTNRTDKISPTSLPYLVTQKTLVVNEDDDICHRLTLYGNNGEVEIDTVSSELIDKIVPLEKGSIIRYATNSKGRIDGIQVLVTVEDVLKDEGKGGSSNSLSEFRWMLVNVYKKYDDMFTVTDKDVNGVINPEDLIMFKPNSDSLYIYDMEKGSVTKGTVDDIYDYYRMNSKYSKMFVQTHTGDLTAIFIFNNAN